MKIKEWFKTQVTFGSVKYTFSLIWDMLKSKVNLGLYTLIILAVTLESIYEGKIKLLAIFVLVVLFLNRVYAQHIIRQLNNRINKQNN